MGRVTVGAKVENAQDLWDVRQGRKTPDQVRSVDIPDALVDSGATTLGLPGSLIQQLGLAKSYEKRAKTAGGTVTVGIYDIVNLTIQGRECKVEVMELPEGSPALIGQIPLELMDWVIDMPAQKLIGNPRHGGEQMFEVWTFWE
ncbi:MAG: retropepsin-like aspartic protease [Gemmataceae bacterium]